jgi:hypothetical protein
MTPGGEGQTAGCGEVSSLDLGNHEVCPARDDGFFRCPERLACIAGLHRQAQLCAAGGQGDCGDRPAVSGDCALLHPDPGPARSGPQRREQEARHGSPVAIGRLCKLMQAGFTQSERKPVARHRRRRYRPDEAPGFEISQLHMFLFCSFDRESRACCQ